MLCGCRLKAGFLRMQGGCHRLSQIAKACTNPSGVEKLRPHVVIDESVAIH